MRAEVISCSCMAAILLDKSIISKFTNAAQFRCENTATVEWPSKNNSSRNKNTINTFVKMTDLAKVQ